MKDPVHVVYLHGLGQTHKSFNYILENLPSHPHTTFDYDSRQHLGDSLLEVITSLPKGDLILVGHSLGGLISVLLAAEDPRIKRIVTISSPIGGSKAAATLRWIPGSLPIMSDITPHSKFINRASSAVLKIPALSIVSTTGHLPAQSEPNDGVVSIESQMALPFGKKAEVKANHFEVLMVERTAKLISDFIGLHDEDHLKAGASAHEKPAT